MKTLKMLQLKLTHFKGIKHFVLDAQGENVRVYGDNATGKTTIFDAFVWLLFDKDSQNKNNFEIKTLDSQNNPIHHLNHEVEGLFNLSGNTLSLKKVFAEKWTKRRGSAEKEFSGHTTDYYIDDVPAKKKEFTDLVSNIVDEDIFKLLTSPTYFNEQLHWQKRREILLEICGDITDHEVISSNKSMAKLPDILGNRTIESHRKVIATKRKEINQELERIPVRIDEVSRSIPDVSELDEKVIKNQIAGLKIRVESKEAELSRIQNGGEISAKEKQFREIEGELLKIKNQINADILETVSHKRQSQYETQRLIDDFKYKMSHLEQEISQNVFAIQVKEDRAAKLRSEWAEENSKQFDFGEHQTTCYACGQALPPEKIEEAKAKAEAHFNLEKSKKLEGIQKQGKAEMTAVSELKAKNDELQKLISDTQIPLDFELAKLDQIKHEIEQLQSNVKDVESDPLYQAKKQEAELVKQEIEQLQESSQEALTRVQSDISKLKSNIELLEQDKSKFAQVDQANARIDELSEQEKLLGAEYERLEEELYLCEEFTRAKVNLLEEKINSKFRYARFKLFSEQINGGLQETCETLFEGVPYSGGLNNAARINVGLDIINTLSEHYGFSAPIFIDNSEAVTKLIDVDSQVISLIVSEADKEIRIETKQEEI